MLSKFKQWLFPSPEELKLRKQELQRRIDERKSKSQPEAVTRVSFPSTKPSPLSPITLSSPACPYCGVIQEPPPTRRRKCRDCGPVIHVRTDREERKKYLLTAEEAERRATKDARLARERRNEEWRRLSEHVRVAMQAGDWKSLQSAYQQQANILFVEGRPHLHVAQEARRAQLMSLLETSICRCRSQDFRRRTGMRTLSVARPQGIHYPRSPGDDAHTQSPLHRWQPTKPAWWPLPLPI